MGNKIIAISAGRNFFKQKGEPYAAKLAYLNYGLLGLVTMLHEQGFDIEMYQANAVNVAELLSIINFSDCGHILLSIPSNYSITWCQELCTKLLPNIPITVGGRWVVDGRVDWIKEKLPTVTNIIEGFGESQIAELFGFTAADGRLQCFNNLDYTLLHDYKKYQPVVEVSRGCGCGCSFCADRCNERLPNKPADRIMSELSILDKLYDNDYKVYFEAPHFLFNKDWCTSYFNQVVKRERVVPWRCTSRVETVPIDDERLFFLSQSGLKIIDIGLESASPTQLLNMSKTNDPVSYLNRADTILHKCKKYGIWIKLNILLYAGETERTVKETVDWLTVRRDLIKGVSCANLMLYSNAGNYSEFIKLGASIPDEKAFLSNGFTGMDLSNEIDLKRALELCHTIQNSFVSLRDYYDLKEHSYFERGFSYSDYLKYQGEELDV